MTARLGVLISGGGRTLLNLLDAIDAGELDATIAAVIASRGDCAGIERAEARGLTVHRAGRDTFPDPVRRDDAITSWLEDADLDLVCLCGYLRKIRLDPPIVGRVLNIHPALLPDFGGRGMYGDRVHAAVLQDRRRFSGCTVHFVDEEYDHGPIVLQRVCPVRPDDTLDALAARVFAEECVAYPEAIRLVASGRVTMRQGRARIAASSGP